MLPCCKRGTKIVVTMHRTRRGFTIFSEMSTQSPPERGWFYLCLDECFPDRSEIFSD